MNEDHPPRASIAGVVPLPVLGMGTAPLGNLFARVSDEAAEGAVAAALSAGIRYFDTAPLYGYGLSERRLGAALSHLPQESIRISTKVGRLIEADAGRTPTEGYLVNGYRAVFDYSRDAVLRSFDESLKRLRRSGVDVLLLHDIGAETHGARHTAIFRQVLDEALPAMQRLKETGACRAIGIGVNESAVCLEMMQRCHLDCILFAGRYTLLEQASLHGVMAQAQRDGTAIIIGGPFNSGLLADQRAPGATYNYVAADAATLARAQRIYDICARHGVDVGAAALQFVLAHPAVASVVVGMRTASEVDSAVARLRAPIEPALWESLRNAGLLLADAPTPPSRW
jgi:D-threo-aldose 1-dehydrogenase